jgi:hypothetical protein
MNRPGTRYKILATRCRRSAHQTPEPEQKARLLQMAEGYERRASEIERDWKCRAQALKARDAARV